MGRSGPFFFKGASPAFENRLEGIGRGNSPLIGGFMLCDNKIHGKRCFRLMSLCTHWKVPQQSLHLDRVAIVTPSLYGTDNSATLDGSEGVEECRTGPKAFSACGHP
jgi:hypothetical protein